MLDRMSIRKHDDLQESMDSNAALSITTGVVLIWRRCERNGQYG